MLRLHKLNDLQCRLEGIVYKHERENYTKRTTNTKNARENDTENILIVDSLLYTI